MTAPKTKLLFLDWRHIRCGHLAWRRPDGKSLGVGNPPEPPVPLQADPQAVPRGIRLAAQPGRKLGVVDNWKGWGRIIHDGGRYRSWHFEINGYTQLGSGAAAHREAPASVFVCGVESEDGFAWKEVSRCPVELADQRGFDGVTFFVDPAAPPAERYKFVYCASFPEGRFDAQVEEYLRRHPRHRDARLSRQKRYGMFALVSPDGAHWTPLPEPFMLHPSDTDTTVIWDGDLERYAIYTRMMRDERRWIGRAETGDFRCWGPVEPVIWPRLDDPPDQDFYLNGYSRYPGAPEYQLMFPMVYHRYTERSEIRLYASADGIAWNQVPGGPVVVPGEDGAWDSEFLGSGKDLMPFAGDRIATPYSGTPYPHKFPRWQQVWDAWNLGWVCWPRDRLSAVVAGGSGEFWTSPAVPAGRRIRLNFRAPKAGRIRVGVEGVDGRQVADCDPLTGDELEREVSWGGVTDLGAAEGQPVSLHIEMRAAELFSVTFA
jgi:hypothetical protein